MTNLTHEKKRMFHVIDENGTKINKTVNVKVTMDEDSILYEIKMYSIQSISAFSSIDFPLSSISTE